MGERDRRAGRADRGEAAVILYHGYAVHWLNPAYRHEAVFIDEPESVADHGSNYREQQSPAPGGQLMLMPLPLQETPKPHLMPRKKKTGHAGVPGQGPAGETCGGCASYRSHRGNTRAYPKCELTKARWTHGPGSDIRKSDPACGRWEAKREATA